MYNIILEGSKGQKVPVLLEDYLIYYAWYWKTLASTCNNTAVGNMLDICLIVTDCYESVC